MDEPVVVVGAGAAGLMAAGFAAEAGRRVVLLESTRGGGKKILVSGGGRCNVLPSALEVGRYVTASSPHALKKMLLSWPLQEQRLFFEGPLGVPLALEAETGKLFPVSNRARDVRDALLREARALGVEFVDETRVVDLVPGASGGPWRVLPERGRAIAAAAVVMATGGLSVPQTGSDGKGLEILRRLGHIIHETYPALTPLTAEPPRHGDLAGISLRVGITVPLSRGHFVTEGGFLFTHRGYSGPAVLDVSHLAVRSRLRGEARQPILVRWTDLGESEWTELLGGGGAGTVGRTVRRHLPDRLADALLAEAGVDGSLPSSQLRRGDRGRLAELLARYPLPWTGDGGYRTAEVTGGGVDLGEIEPRTLESRRHPGLFVCGEMLDAFGPIGGYNFAWAWATGRAAGRGAGTLAAASGVHGG